MSGLIPYAGYDPTESILGCSKPLVVAYKRLSEDLKAAKDVKPNRSKERFREVIHNVRSNSGLTCRATELAGETRRIPLALPEKFGTIRLHRAAVLICAMYGMEPADVFGKQRLTKGVLDPYRAFLKFLRRQRLSLPQIGRIVQRHHTTVLMHLRKVGGE